MVSLWMADPIRRTLLCTVGVSFFSSPDRATMSVIENIQIQTD